MAVQIRVDKESGRLSNGRCFHVAPRYVQDAINNISMHDSLYNEFCSVVLEGEGMLLFLTNEDDQVIAVCCIDGSVIALGNKKYVTLNGFAVADTFRKQGWGKRFFDFFVSQHRFYDGIFLNSETDALGFWTKLGFTATDLGKKTDEHHTPMLYNIIQE